jgi:hypothetical protein
MRAGDAPAGLDGPAVGSARACWQAADLRFCPSLLPEETAMYIGAGTIVLIVLVVLLVLFLRRRA